MMNFVTASSRVLLSDVADLHVLVSHELTNDLLLPAYQPV